MSLSRQGGRRSWRILSQLSQSSNSSSLPRPPSAHLGLQKFRLHGSFSISSSSCLHQCYSSPSFSTAAEAAHMANSADPEASTAAEAAHMANSADPEAISSVDSVSEKHKATSSSSNVQGEQEESILRKMLEEHRELVNSLRAELDDQKTLARSILDEIRVLKSNVNAETAGIKVSDKKQQYLEWVAFMEHLQSSEFFKDEKREPSSDRGSVLEDPVCVKRAIYKFSRAHESIFESLSPIDLRIIARHGSSANDSKASAAQKRLCQFFHIEELSSDASAAKPAFIQPKLSDVTRLLYSTVLDGTFEEDVKSSISHLLREIVTLSKKSSGVPLPAAEHPLSSKLNATLSAAVDTVEVSKQEKLKDMKNEKPEDIQKVGTAKREEAVKTAAARPETSVRVPEWKCPRCSFMNLDTKHRCVECSRRRPQRTYGSERVKSPDDISVVEEDLDFKLLVEERQAKKVHERKATLPSPSTQGRESLKDRSSSFVIQDKDTMGIEDSSDETNTGSEGSEAFSVLDDILDSEDSDEDQQGESKIVGLSDDSEEEQQGNAKRTPLSNLFPKLKSRSSPRRDDQRGLEQRNGKRLGNKLSKSKRFEDDDGNGRSRHGSVGEDSEDDNSPPQRSGRGFSSQGDDYSRRPGRGGYNSFRGRGGPRGYGGGRGDSFDSRSDAGPRGSSAGNRDGGRSSSYGSRPQRGRPGF